jgi:hypothetical protein
LAEPARPGQLHQCDAQESGDGAPPGLAESARPGQLHQCDALESGDGVPPGLAESARPGQLHQCDAQESDKDEGEESAEDQEEDPGVKAA